MKENHKHTEATGRRRSSCNSNSNRKPLSDCINIINSRNPAQSSSSTSTKNSTSFIKPTNDNTSLNPSAVSVNSVSTPSRAPKPSSDKGNASASPSREAFEPHSVYSRRQSADKRKGKRKAIAEPMSCFPALKTQFTGSSVRESLKKMMPSMLCPRILLRDKGLTLQKSMLLNCRRRKLLQLMNWTE
ncbi:vitellogenin-2 isoform X2 [Ricinus communis]|uniref:vitellogenin-2 isoform X2 n=1 Tax=Ricinus communis TaxID=3988 RepID=UPI00201ACA3E|nr:vitellogenin-2 isoform X2 [Ricinus communis]